MNLLFRHACWLLCLGIVAGCQSAEEPASTATAAVEAPAPAAPAPATAKKATKPTPDLANPKIASAAVAEFKPPFPERTELFEPPKRAQTTVQRDAENGGSVELKGFMNVDQPKVVLSIDGVISPIPEGGERYGVHVISIQPPKAVLQRGRNRWTATLE
jgi:hypothetical protein